jgi:molybdopterin-guanine dinucleotide biosynthesis protein A
MLHHEVAPLMASAAEQGRLKLHSALETAAATLAVSLDVPLRQVLLDQLWDDRAKFDLQPLEGSQNESWHVPTKAQLAARHLWFANLNTPEEFAEALRHVHAIDT